MSENEANRQRDPYGSSGSAPSTSGAAGDGGAGAGYGEPHTHRYDQPHDAPHDAPHHDTHRYDTAAWGGNGWGGQGWDPRAGYYGPHPAPAAHAARTTDRPRGRGAFTAAVLAAALVVGGLAGLGGAAGFAALSAFGGDGSESQSSVTSSVIDRKDAPAAEGSVQAVAESVLPSVVKINVRGPQAAGSGSGVVISDDGEILTNYHVVQAAASGGEISVGFNDGSTASAEILGVDPLVDLAVIKAEGVSGLAPAQLGESGNLDVGEQVVAIGSPFGLEATVTSGIVSALNRPVSISGQGSSINTTYPAIQTDAAINPGNSGGPLVNMNGEVVGINSSIRTSSSSMGQGGSIGLGFAIPLEKVLPIVDQIRDGETPTHARLGVSVLNASSDDGLLSGAGIAEVTAGSAAAEAGLQRGDVVVRVGEQQISDASSLVAMIRGHRPGDTVTLTVVRSGETVELEATLDSDEGDPTS
jgi:putative serine protease PepD